MKEKVTRKRHDYTTEEKQYLQENYLSKPTKYIADYLNLTYDQTRKYIKRHIENPPPSVKISSWSEDEINTLISNVNLNYNELLSLLPYKDQRQVEDKIRALNLNRYDGNRLHFPDINSLKSNMNNFFYFLFLFAADGCLYNGPKNPYKVYIGLKSPVAYLLKRILMLLKCDPDMISYRKKGDMCEFSLYCEELYNLLKSFGITERKSLTLRYISNVPSINFAAALRGYLDGDGSISIYNQGKSYQKPVVQFLGTYDFLFGLSKTLNSTLNIPLKTPQKTQKECYRIRYYTAQARSILDYIYSDLSDDDLYLTRKHSKYIKYRDQNYQFYN